MTDVLGSDLAQWELVGIKSLENWDYLIAIVVDIQHWKACFLVLEALWV